MIYILLDFSGSTRYADNQSKKNLIKKRCLLLVVEKMRREIAFFHSYNARKLVVRQ